MPAENTQYSCHRIDLKSVNSRIKRHSSSGVVLGHRDLFHLNNLRVEKELELWLKTPNAKVSVLENKNRRVSLLKKLRKHQSMVLGTDLRFSPPLKYPPAAQFNIQIIDNRIQMIIICFENGCY